MFRYIKKHKSISSIVLGLLFIAVFIMLVEVLRLVDMDATSWRFISGLQRLIFGIIQVCLFVWLFNKKSWHEVINAKGFGKGMLAGCGVILFTIYYIPYLIFGAIGFEGLTPLLFIGIIFQQITTGLWEEIAFRGFLIDGIMIKIGRKWYGRLIAAIFSVCIFGSLHMMGTNSFSQALDRFVTTGIMGLAFAAIYIYSHNLMAAMVLHAIFDIPANLINYVADFTSHPIKVFLDNIFYPLYLILAILSIVFIVIAKPWEEKRETDSEHKVKLVSSDL